METTVVKLAAELCGADEDSVLLQALCDAAEGVLAETAEGRACGRETGKTHCGAPRLSPRRRTIWGRTAPGRSPSQWEM